MTSFRRATRSGVVLHRIEWPTRPLAPRRAPRVRDGEVVPEAPAAPHPTDPQSAAEPVAAPPSGKSELEVRARLAERAVRAADPEGDEVQLLRRRLNKVVAQLEAQEALLRDRERAVEDPGVASIYRNVQGIDPADRDRERKLELMRVLFRSNQELKERITSFRRSAE